MAAVGFIIFLLLRNKALEGKVATANNELHKNREHCESEIARIQNEAQTGLNKMQKEVESARKFYEDETVRQQTDAKARIAEAQTLIDQQYHYLRQEAERMRQHFENETQKMNDESSALLAKTIRDLEPLRKYEGIRDAEAEAKRTLTEALNESEALRTEAQSLLRNSEAAAELERAEAKQKAKELRTEADALLNQAIRDAGRIVSDAHKQAEHIAGEAYTALRNKDSLEQAAEAIRNVIDGYGDRYLIPLSSGCLTRDHL